MAETVVKTIESIDELFSQIVVNGEVHESTRYVLPVATQTQTSSPSQSTQTSTNTEAISDTPVRQTQGQDVYGVELNDVLHDFVDQRVTQALEEEVTAREDADTQLQTNIDNEEMARQQADYGLGQRITAIENVIPNQATPSNQLADKAFVNSSIATNTANFLGTYTSMADIEAIPNPTNNDYVFLEITDASGNSGYDRYKYSSATNEWLFEYELNNSSFTAEQWDTINSGLTQASVSSDISSAIEALDVSAVGGSGNYIKQISQTDGKITAVTGNITSSITSGSNDPVTSGAVADALANIDVTDAETAEKLKTARSLKVALGSTTAQSFDGSADATSIGVSGTLPVANGGTGQTTAKGAEYNIIGGVEQVATDFDDNRYIAVQNQTVSASNGTFRWFKVSNLWNYIKGKIASVLHLKDITDSSSGNAYNMAVVTAGLGANSTYRKSILLMCDITALDGVSSNGASYGFIGKMFAHRQGGYLREHCSDWKITAAYNESNTLGDSLQLYTTDTTYVPIKIHNESTGKTYLGIRYGYGNETNCTFVGTFQNMTSGFIGTIHLDASTNKDSNGVTWTEKATGYTGMLNVDLWGSDGGKANFASQSDYTRGTAYCTTDGATQAKVASMRGYVLQSGATFPITFAYANSYSGVITLNVNSTGAKNIYINNAVTSSSNKTLPAGTYLCRYNGSYYYIDTGYFVTNARNAYHATDADEASDAYFLGAGRGAVNGYYIVPSYDSTNNWVKMSGRYGTGSSTDRNSCVDVALKIRTSAPNSPSDGDIWIE